MDDDSSVRVAVRIRPQISRELIEMSRVCTSVTPGEPQVWIGSDKAFTFDYVFDIDSVQTQVYETSIQQLIEGCFEGYNATVLAYGQTGSGKTYTMGTGFDVSVTDDELGIIPRAVDHLFDGIEERRQQAYDNNQPLPDFKIHCQFMELYNEEIVDLFDTAKDATSKGRRSNIRIHEDSNGCIYTVGVTTRVVTSKNETLQCLKIGALSRTTASTQMNAQSSRSHAIFTLHIKQLRAAKIKDPDMEMDTVEGIEDFETLTAKFHFVDLAGSERLKRTGATGDRAKEGISINCGLLALGNVISALGDLNKLGSHVPYRDSKLTRLLQDSLGGNSRTTMIACISPSDSDFMETLNTLKYANRARNIKNKIVANQDKTSKTLSVLRNEIQKLQLELMEYKQGKRVINRDGEESINDMYHENTMLQTESNNLRVRVKAMQETIEQLTARNTELLAEKATSGWISTGGDNSDMTKMVHEYIKEVEELRVKLMESENVCQNLRKNASRGQNRLSMSPLHNQAVAFSGLYDVGCDSEASNVNGLLQEAKRDLVKMMGSTKGGSKLKRDNDEEGIENEGDRFQVDEPDSDSEEIPDDNLNEESSESEEEDAIDEQYQSDLAELTCEISIKQRLIDELERSQKRLQTMRHQYEDKLIQLQNKIKATQEERDKVLANLGNVENLSDEKVKKIKGDYERKLGELTGELKKVHSAKKEHARLLKSQMQYEQQMRNLRTELGEMKKAKVRLMNKIKDESSKHKEVEQRRNREIAQLKKESRVRENQIRTLEAEKKLKEAVLKRKQEEVQALRRNTKPMSDRVAGRFGKGKNILMKNQVTFSPKIAKTKWQRLENEITKLVLNKKTVTHWEKEMERRLQEREELGRSLDSCIRKRDAAMLKGKDDSNVRDITDQIEALQANIDYVQENIADCQARIMQLEESKEGHDFIDTNALVTELNSGETKYLIEKLLNMTISQSTLATQREASLKEAEAKIIQAEQNNSVHQELLEHMLNQQNMGFYSYLYTNDDEPSGESAPTSRSASPSESLSFVTENKENNGLSSSSSDSLRKSGRVKARRRTAANSEELLFGMPRDGDATDLLVLSDIKEEIGAVKSNAINTSQSKSLIGSSLTSSSSYSMSKSDFSRPTMPAGRLSPRMVNKFGHFSTNSNPAPQIANDQFSNATPPISPTPSRKYGREENVFSRLTNGTTSFVSTQPNLGSISAYSGKSFVKSSPLYCCLVAEGHSKAVLSVVATENLMFTASKDRTVKVWDLQRGQETITLGSHPNNVCVVRYCERTRQVFSASSAYIKVWDLREGGTRCIKTLFSSGSTCNGHMSNSTLTRVLKIPTGEHQMNDLNVDSFGMTLFSAAGNSVRIWDLRKYASIGKLNGNNQAAVTCLAVNGMENRNYQVVTGSKDHYIKVFEVPVLASGIHQPKYNLEPPHYDGIVSLAVTRDSLFSGSRDMCIKKWDLGTFELKQSLNQAHKDWICGLCVVPGEQSILSCCRGGFIRQWSTDSCAMLGEMKAHERPINDITTNRTSIFTASEDTTVRIWKPRGSSDSPDISECG